MNNVVSIFLTQLFLLVEVGMRAQNVIKIFKVPHGNISSIFIF
jgi:hypothetical protein